MEKSPFRLLKLSFDRASRETSLWQNPENFVLDFSVFTLKLWIQKVRALIDIFLILYQQIKF